jgi:hypothetical protein
MGEGYCERLRACVSEDERRWRVACGEPEAEVGCVCALQEQPEQERVDGGGVRSRGSETAVVVGRACGRRGSARCRGSEAAVAAGRGVRGCRIAAARGAGVLRGYGVARGVGGRVVGASERGAVAGGMCEHGPGAVATGSQ